MISLANQRGQAHLPYRELIEGEPLLSLEGIQARIKVQL